MARFLDAAYRVLSEQGKPLTAVELTAFAQENGYLKTSGKTPSQTMKSKLSTDILSKKDRSMFMRTGEGRFGLRHWKGESCSEYVADRFAKGLLNEEVAVFASSSLTKYIPGPGLHPITLANSESLITECKSMLREDAEQDFSVIQLVSVFILRHGCYYLTYKRTKRLPESRLHGFYSMVFGGHINPPEVNQLFNIFRPEHEGWGLRRELEEEVRINKSSNPHIIYKGLLFDDRQAVSTQHLGIVYDVILHDRNFEIGEKGFLMDPKFETLDEIENRSQDFENWSMIVAQYEREQMNNSCCGGQGE